MWAGVLFVGEERQSREQIGHQSRTAWMSDSGGGGGPRGGGWYGDLRQASPQTIYNLWSSALTLTHSLRHISERLSGKTLF